MREDALQRTVRLLYRQCKMSNFSSRFQFTYRYWRTIAGSADVRLHI